VFQSNLIFFLFVLCVIFGGVTGLVPCVGGFPDASAFYIREALPDQDRQDIIPQSLKALDMIGTEELQLHKMSH